MLQMQHVFSATGNRSKIPKKENHSKKCQKAHLDKKQEKLTTCYSRKTYQYNEKVDGSLQQKNAVISRKS